MMITDVIIRSSTGELNWRSDQKQASKYGTLRFEHGMIIAICGGGFLVVAVANVPPSSPRSFTVGLTIEL
jgi:hypothetical protein